jgi:general secretion pathway protein M
MADRATTNSRRATAAAAIYAAVIAVLAGAIWITLSALGNRYATVQAAETALAQLEGRTLRTAKDGQSDFGGAPVGSPFLEGQTQTVGGAALLQRIAGAVNQAGGNVLSSQVELQKADAQEGWIGLLVSCEVEQPALQTLLYDIESGMPFLFVDQLTVQAPIAGVEKSRMRVMLSVSGQWQGPK